MPRSSEQLTPDPLTGSHSKVLVCDTLVAQSATSHPAGTPHRATDIRVGDRRRYARGVAKEVSQQLAWLAHLDYEGDGEESVRAALEDYSREQVDDLLVEAISAWLDARQDAERQIERFRRRLNKGENRS